MTMLQLYKRSQHFVFITISVLIILLSCQSLAFARGQTNGDLPSKADVQNQLDTLNKQKDLSAQDKLVQQDLIDTLATLDKIERVKEETVQLRQKVAQAPEKMRQATAALNALSDVDNDDEMRKTLSALSLRQLELRVAQVLDDLQNSQNDLAAYNSQLVSLQTQPERVQNAMYTASQQIQQIRNRLDGNNVAKPRFAPANRCYYRHNRRCLMRRSTSNVRVLKGIPFCRTPCKNSGIT